ncbi:fluoride efflux transporter FluC [Naumannella halotolerans]|uniref:fluoride efflux transporter FluC n=1 Tax=Naumannella halotolerans TaxID=993414 RepID=UPI00370CFFBD
MTESLLLATFGALGAICRALLEHRFATADPAVLPRGVLIANLLGSLLIGALHGWADLNAHYLLATGFIGALTTWSSFSLGTARLLHHRRYRLAVINIVLNLGGGVLAALAGSVLGVIIFA